MPGRLVHRDHGHVARRRILDVRRVPQVDQQVAPHVVRQSRIGSDEGRNADGRMVHQVLADAGEVVPDFDSHVLEVPRGADAVAHQHSGRMDGATGENDLARPERLLLALVLGNHADAAQPFEDQRFYLGFRLDPQVLTQAHTWVEIADRGGDPPVVGVRDGDGEMPVLPFAVHVGMIGIAGLLEGLRRSMGVGSPEVRKDAADRDPALVTMVRTFEIHVAFELAEEGQAFLPAPALGAHRLPLVVIVGRATVGELPVDRRAAAQHPRLLVFAQRRPVRRVVVGDWLRVDLQLRPVEALIEVCRARIAVENLGGHLAVRCVGPRLEHQNSVGAPGGQPIGHDTSRGAAANDDKVVFHPGFPYRSDVRSVTRLSYRRQEEGDDR